MLSEIQTKKLTYYFGLYDYDKDGYITEADLKKITANIAELRGWKQGWQIYDAAETVMMAHEEYMLQSEERYQEYAVQMTEGVFDILDEDGDGILTAENYRMLFLIFGMPGELANDSFNQIDLDHDGRIDLKDIHQSVREFHCSNNIDDPGNFMFGPWNSESDH
jgi:Ca2+-binding EF-hand superfamily protein